MTRAKLDTFREQLRHLVGRMQHDAWAIQNHTSAPSGGQADGGLSNAPMHLADIGTDEWNHEINSTVLENEQYLLNEVLTALRRLDDGTFGRCEACGQPISEKRLEAIPYTRACLDCADRLLPPPANVNTGRPQDETETIAAPEKLVIRQEESAESIHAGLSDQMDGAADTHAAGTAGGGTEIGGLAGTNIGDGNPEGVDLERAMGSGASSIDEEDLKDGSPHSGHAGGAVGGTPAGKRAGKRRRAAR